MKVGLIGEKLGHSFSKEIHEQIASYSYDLIPLSNDEFHKFMKKKEFDAINVTIPYKEKVISYCDELDDKAQKINAVNAIKKVDEKLIATNTDFDGLMWMIKRHFNIKNKVVAICGSGGTSKTALAVCEALQAKVIQVARHHDAPYITYEEMKKHQEIQFILNTTSVGMSPNILNQIVDLNDFSHCEGVIDVVYNPLLTSLCYQAKQKHIPYVNGLEMLVGQAISAIEFFTGQYVDKHFIQNISNQLFHEKQNIVLIGMPSCGKTTIGKILSHHIGFDFIDIDTEIEKLCGKSIPELFEIGEEYFREMETSVTLEISKKTHCVISCGGGIIKNEVNMKALSLNGWIVYLKRNLDFLHIGENRPLSKDFHSLRKMEVERMPLYLKYSDVTVENNQKMIDTVRNIVEVWNENISA